MRALIVTNMWPDPETPELGIFVSDQVDALRRAGVEVEVHSFRGGSAAAYVRAARELRSHRLPMFDVVHAHFGLSAWVARAQPARVRAVTFHGTDLSHPRSRRLSLAALRFIDLPAAASAELAGSIPEGRLRRPVAILPCGFSGTRFVPGPRMQARSDLGIDPEERVILFPASPDRREKRFDRAQDLARMTGARLIPLGGVVPYEVPKWIRASDLVAITSEREGFGLAALEALSCGVPVLSTPHGIAREALAGIEGTLCAEWEAARWAAAAEAIFASPPSIDATARIAKWSAETCARDVIDAWRGALDAA